MPPYRKLRINTRHPCYKEECTASNEYQRTRRLTRRAHNQRILAEWFIVKNKRTCSRCRYVGPWCHFECAHKDRTQKKYHISQLVSHGYSEETLRLELDKCDCVCLYCHAEETCDESGWAKDLAHCLRGD